MADDQDVAGGHAHDPEHLRGDGDVADDLRLVVLHHGPVGGQDAMHELRAVERPAVGERAVGVDQLERRDGVVALADARLVHLAGVDRLVEDAFLPGVVGNDAGRLAGQVDAGLLTEAPLVGEVRQAIDPEAPGHLVEEGVGRVGEPVVDRQRPEPGPVPVVVAIAPDREVGMGHEPRLRRDLAVLEPA